MMSGNQFDRGMFEHEQKILWYTYLEQKHAFRSSTFDYLIDIHPGYASSIIARIFSKDLEKGQFSRNDKRTFVDHRYIVRESLSWLGVLSVTRARRAEH